MQQGKKLKKGDTIGLVSPAGPEDPKAIKKGIEFLKSLGFNIKEGKHLYDKEKYLAGSDIDRATDLMDMFKDTDVDMILCVRGGYGTMRILPLLDFDIIKKNPKIFMGFSDITTLLNMIAQKSNIITFHGPMGSSSLDEKYTLESFLNMLTNCKSEFKIDNPKDFDIKEEVAGYAEGEIVGGNLCLICSTLGTPYEIDFKNKILFIEEIGEAPYKIDRMLTQLLLCNKLQECSGFILGQFKGCELSNYERSFKLDEVIRDRILSLGKPTLSNIMSGHDYPKLTIPIGCKCLLDTYAKSIKIIEPVVSEN